MSERKAEKSSGMGWGVRTFIALQTILLCLGGYLFMGGTIRVPEAISAATGLRMDPISLATIRGEPAITPPVVEASTQTPEESRALPVVEAAPPVVIPTIPVPVPVEAEEPFEDPERMITDEEALADLSEGADGDLPSAIGGLPPLSQVEAEAVIMSAAPETIDAIAEAARISPEIAAAIAQGRLLNEGASSIDWGKDNLGYIGAAKPGDVIPGMERVESAPDEWVVGDQETEGGGDTTPRYDSVNGSAAFSESGTLTVGDEEIILSGIVIPDSTAQCLAADGVQYDCAAWALEGLNAHITGKTAFCSVSEIGGLSYGICDVILNEDGKAIDLASWMVGAGIALAQDVPAPSLYYAQEAEARGRKAGLWEGTFSFGGRTAE